MRDAQYRGSIEIYISSRLYKWLFSYLNSRSPEEFFSNSLPSWDFQYVTKPVFGSTLPRSYLSQSQDPIQDTSSHCLFFKLPNLPDLSTSTPDHNCPKPQEFKAEKLSRRDMTNSYNLYTKLSRMRRDEIGLA